MNTKINGKLLFTIIVSITIFIMAFYLNETENSDTLYTSLYYLPLIIVGLWYYRFVVPLAMIYSLQFYILDSIYLGSASFDQIFRGLVMITGSIIMCYLGQRLNRKNKELEISRSSLAIEKEHLRITLQSIGDGIISTDYNGNVIILNEVAKNLTGWLDASAIGRPVNEVFQIINEYTREKSEDPIKKVLETGQAIKLANHTVLIAKDGTERSIADSAAPIRDENGDRHGVILVFRDVTERKRAEDAIRSNRRQLADIIEFLPDATLAIDKEGHVIIWNKAIEKMTGISASEMVGKGDYAYTIPFYGKARPQLLDLLFLSDEELVTQYPKITRGGNSLIAEAFCPVLNKNKGAWVIAKASPLHDQTGNIIGAIESIRDITDRKLVESALRSSEEKYRLITENVSDVISVFNVTKNKFSYVSPSVLKMRGFTAEEAMNERLEESLAPEVLAIVRDEVARNVKEFIENPKEPKNYISEGQQSCKNGDLIWVEISRTYRYNTDGDIESVGVIRKIDERKKAEKQLLYISYHDQLTGLFNRRFYEEELKRLDTTRNLPLTIVMGDVNGLKQTNDLFGHDMGDMLLRKTAEAIKNGCRSDDIIARLGGDEFVMILPKTDASKAEQIVKRIESQSLADEVGNIDISISFGYATKNNKEENIQEIFKCAENLMYQQKHVGLLHNNGNRQ